VPLRDFLVSPGIVAVAAVVAALIVLIAVLFAIRRAGKRQEKDLEQRDRHHEAARDAEQRAASAAQCWKTFTWLVDTAGIEPAASEGATLGVGPELAMATLRGLLRDAERLGDETLADAVTAYQNQFALILAQQSGSLSELAAGAAPRPVERKPPRPAEREPQQQALADKDQPAAKADDRPATGPAADDAPTTTTEMVGDGRRHRR
jgi:hypothetical protein